MYRIERYSRRSNDRKKRGIYIFHNKKRKGDIHKKEYSDKKRGEIRGKKTENFVNIIITEETEIGSLYRCSKTLYLSFSYQQFLDSEISSLS